MSELPVSTYRLQLRPGFGFAEVAGLADYLAGLGVSHVYLSPVLQAAPGSTHGYDVVDHSRVSEELGGEDGLRAMVARLRSYGLKVVVDVVPNHMAMPVPESLNRPLWSVLAEGRASPYARWFDVDWEYGDGRIVLPVLGAPRKECADELVRDGTGGGPEGQGGGRNDVLRYYEHVFPLPEDHYELAYWRDGPNYRRFFEISTLLGVRVEEPEVFAATHEVTLRLLREGLLHGLRVDHPDGLADPRGYLRRLAEATGGVWTVVEKILTGDEALPGDWPCAGTTGYDALGMIDGLFVDPAGEEPLTDAYVAFTGGPADFTEVEHAAKREVAERGLLPEVRRLHRALCRALPSADPEALRAVLIDLLVAMPVYRAYVVPGEEAPQAREILEGAAEGLQGPEVEAVVPVLSGLGCTDEAVEVVTRFQQTSGALTAKGVEDTAFYRWSRLSSRNEVGGDPKRFAVSPGEFHEFCDRLSRDWPGTMTTLSTHDTKRQEDVRARLAVLAERPDEWTAAIQWWRSMGPPDSPLEPDLEYLLWQTLVGAWPLDGERLAGFLTKAMREAKTRTSWTDPDPAYERAVLSHAARLVADTPLMADVASFVARLEPYARVNVLGQKLVQLTMPGVPDTYQGCELTGRSLVDPDNRRPVDFERARARLTRLDAGHEARDLDDEKLLVTSRALRLRRDRPEWFSGYEPVRVYGPAAEHVIAFGRGRAITFATRLPAGLERRGGWSDTFVEVPEADWHDVLTGIAHPGSRLRIEDLLAELPVALLAPARPDRGSVSYGTGARRE